VRILAAIWIWLQVTSSFAARNNLLLIIAGYMGAAVQDYRNWTKVVNGVSSNTTLYATTEQANDAIAFIQSRRTNLWFVWLAFSAPHGPINKPPTNILATAAYINLSGTPADINTNGRAYQEAMTQALDTEIGRVIDVVPTNTDIVFLGDNGSEIQFQQPPYYYTNNTPDTNGHAKFTLYEGGSRTPCFITGPDVVNGGRTNNTLVNEVDMFQTIQELAGINVAATLPANVIIDSKACFQIIGARPSSAAAMRSQCEICRVILLFQGSLFEPHFHLPVRGNGRMF
jgi:hypothetical protein